MTHTELEAEYNALCKRVEADTLRIVGLCLANRTDAAGEAAATLNAHVATARQQYAMQQEQTGAYDLAALNVNTSVPSNSETGWERED